jgi:hypothetical protein
MTRKLVPISAMVAVIFVATLAGCSSSNPSSSPSSSPPFTQSSTPSASSSATTTPILTAGVKVTNTGGTFIEELQKGLAPGLHLIRLGDTLEYMVVDEHQPLPAEVLDPVVAQVKAGYPAPGAPNGDALSAAIATVGDLEASAGKYVVLYNGSSYLAVIADGQSPLGSAGQPLYKEYTKAFLANRPKSVDAMIAQFAPFAERAGCPADRLVFIQYTN